MAPSSQTCELLAQVLGALDYSVLGAVYCDDGGEAFWADRRPAVVELGLAWAAEVAPRLTPAGRSIYVGAGVAELPVLLTEVVDLQRSCVVTNLCAEECDVINSALAGAGLAAQLVFRNADALGECEGSFDHVCAVSVFDDPECYPWVSGVTYGRVSPVELDTAAFEQERTRVSNLVETLMRGLVLPGVVTTSVEEVSWFAAAARDLGVGLEIDDEVVETALVGDPISLIRVVETAP